MEILNLTEKEAKDKLLSLGFADPGAALINLRLLADTPFNGSLKELLRLAVQSPSPDACLNNLERAAKEVPPGYIEESLKNSATLPSLERIFGSSHYLTNIICQDPALYGWLFIDNGIAVSKDLETFLGELNGALKDITDVNGVMRALRVYRHKEYLRIGSRDLLGMSDVKATTAELSYLAEASLDAAVEFSERHLKNSYGAPMFTDQDGSVLEAVFTVIGLGKLGGGELNFSSDIDIIYVYSSDNGETYGIKDKPNSKISLHAFFIKLAAMVNKLIGAVTEDGFVFRVDLDLRPEGRSGDLCGSLRSMEIYYESWGQMWERAAFIKARPVGGNKPLGAEFLAMIRPFIYRRYLDFTAIEEIKAMKEKIDLGLLRKDPETIDVKLGTGGIREIEFFCQALQLIHGGKDPELREKNTLRMIERLREKGFLKEKEATALRDGYIFLRNLEHRIQIVEGLQTQAIPATRDALERLARMMDFKDTSEETAGAAFRAEFKEKTASIHEVYRSLFYKGDAEPEERSEDVSALLSPDATKEEGIERFKALGFKDPEAAYGNLILLLRAPTRARLSARGHVIIGRLLPLFISAAIKAPDPDMALGHLERFTYSVGVRTTFYSLLLENRLIIEELVKLLGSSVFLSRLLIERPESLETLLSKELSIPYKRRSEFLTELDYHGGLTPSADYEDTLDALRRLKNQEVFRIGINDLRGTLTPRQVSRQITFLACAALDAALKISSAKLEKIYGAPDNARLCILGMGRLGGADLIYGSDLDIVFVYDGEDGASTQGPRAITNREFFVKLGARIISVLTLKTKDGSVFNVDTRLRPSGSSGPLVVSKAALFDYHRGKTAVWERQAWLKARPVAGDVRSGEKILTELDAVIYGGNTPFNRPLADEDMRELLRIRKRMETEIAKEDSTRFNIKTGAGGMVDVEFLIQALQLENFEDRALRTPYTLKALKRLVKKGLIAKEDGAFLKEAYGFYRLIELRQRIVHDRPEGYLYKGSPEGGITPPEAIPPSTETLARRCGYGGDEAGKRLLADYERYAKRVRMLYLRTLEAITGA